jgi:hypothetical protein
MMISKGKGGNPLVLQLAEKRRQMYTKWEEYVSQQAECGGHEHDHEDMPGGHQHREPGYVKGLRDYLTTPKGELDPARHPAIGLTLAEADEKVKSLQHTHMSKEPNFVKHQEIALTVPGYVQYILKA